MKVVGWFIPPCYVFSHVYRIRTAQDTVSEKSYTLLECGICGKRTWDSKSTDLSL